MASQGVLVQAWLPWLPEGTGGSLAVQSHCWFLSALLPYWMLFDVLFRRAVKPLASLAAGCACLLLLALPAWVALLVPGSVGGDPAWYASHRHGALHDATDYAVVLLKFHPACYLHVFLFGMVLARVRLLLAQTLQRRAEAGAGAAQARARLNAIGCLQLLFRFGASVGVTGLLVVFLCRSVRIQSYPLSARLSVLMPLQGLIIVGLAPIRPPSAASSGKVAPSAARSPLAALAMACPVEMVFRHASPQLGNVSYAMFLLQYIAYYLWPRARIESVRELCCFMLWLLATAYLASRLIIAPLAGAWHRASPRALILLTLCVSAVGAACCAADRAARLPGGSRNVGALLVDGCGNVVNTSRVVLPPPFVTSEDAVDLRVRSSSCS